jgi:hypothetical protein
MHINHFEYDLLRTTKLPLSEDIFLIDHLNGFSFDLKNSILDLLVERKCSNTIYLQYIVDSQLKEKYKSINVKFSSNLQNTINFSNHINYKIHPEINYKNFICSFNGSPHVSRKLLVSILNKFGYFDTNYCSKNFSYSVDMIEGHISECVGNQDNFYNKFFIATNSDDFFQNKFSFGHVRYNHSQNIHNLENKITQSFLHIVSETMATSYVPFVTEKFLYSIVTRGLFLAYAQPGWHAHVEKYYGFKRYTKLFNYHFDTIQNPIERLVELITMIGKFSHLTSTEWRDLYLLEQDTIEYNYDHYFSKNYLIELKKYENKL